MALLSLGDSMHHTDLSVIFALACCYGSGALAAASDASAELTADRSRQIADREINAIVVTGVRRDPVVEAIGSITLIDPEILRRQQYSDIFRALRIAPGLTFLEEEGFGLRPNIGIRGSGMDRSGRIALMEDGILIAPAPYADARTHYVPTTGRMKAVEVVKGPAAVRYGPLTSGGAITFFSTPVPEDGPSATLASFYGEDDTYRVHLNGGYGGERVGFLFETYQTGSDGFQKFDIGGDTGFTLQDYLVKLRLSTGDDAAVPQSLLLKFQYSDEDSASSYLGLTDADFAADPYRRYNASQLDTMLTEHTTLQATHDAELGETVKLTTTAYRTTFVRDWFKLENVSGVSITDILEDPVAFAAQFADIVAAPGYRGADDALEIRNNDRDYWSWGVQSQLGFKASGLGAEHEMIVNVRYHADQIDRFQNNEFYRADNGSLILTSEGAPGSETNRIERGRAFSAFFQDTAQLGRLSALFGLRYENIELGRDNFGRTDPTRTGANLRTVRNRLDILLPSLGVDYRLTDNLSVFGGVHRGFSPPSNGSADAEPETSLGYEAGARLSSGGLFTRATFFFNDYQNLIGVCTNSTGGGCNIGDQFDAGAVEVVGVELEGRAAPALGGDWRLPLAFAYTLTDGEFKETFASEYDPWGDVEAGDSLPTVPRHQLFLLAGLEHNRFGGSASVSYVSETRSRAGAGSIPAAERIEPHVVTDANVYYELVPGRLRIKAIVENLFANDYAVARAPAGLRPGKPRTALIGIEASL